MLPTTTLSIADICLSFNWNPGTFKIDIDQNLAAFSVQRPYIDESHILFSVNDYGVADLSTWDLIFNTSPNSLWKLWRAKDSSSYLLSLHRNEQGDEPYQVVIANNHLSDFKVLNMNGEKNINISDFPLELVLSGYLNINKKGVFLHSAMVVINGKGILFPGMPGSGKSSIAKLCLQDKDCEVLTDERVILREKDGLLYAYGTPWHSTLPVYKNKGAPLHKIFFIKHGKENSLQKISTLDAANRLMVRCFPTFWHKEGMEFALDFCSRIASEVECYEFGFVPDNTSVELIKEFVKT